MAGQRGRDVLIKVSDGNIPETFETLAGIRSSEIDLNTTSVDSTAADSDDGWRELLSGAGVRTARIRGRGVFKDASSDDRIRDLFFAQDAARWQLIIPGMGALKGPFQISEIKWSGVYDGEASFAIELVSAGKISFEAYP